MAVTINSYDQFVLKIGEGTIDLDTDTHKIELYNSTHAFIQANDDRTDISANALATANGYTNPGQNLASVTWTQASGTAKFDAADITWTASGGSIGPARFAVIYDDTVVGPPADLLELDINFGQDETAGNGTDFKVNFNASGIFTIG